MKLAKYLSIVIFVVMAVWPHQTYPAFVLRYGMIQGFVGGIMITVGVLQDFYQRKEK